MNGVNIKIKGAANVIRAINAIARDIKTDKTPYRQASVFLFKWVQNNFKTEGGKTEKTWKDLKLKGRWKGKGKNRYFQTDYKILQDEGRLRQSFKPFFTKDNAGIGSELPYSKTHEHGDKSKNIPQRRILPKRVEVMPDIYDIFNWFIDKVLKRNG